MSYRLCSRPRVCVQNASVCAFKDASVPQADEDHTAETGYNSLSRYNLVHKFIHLLQAMMTPDAKAAVDKE